MSKKLQSLLPLISTIGLLFSNPQVMAQPAGAIGNDFIYQVESGDTLINLSELYTTSPNTWRQIQTINRVEDPLLLPIGKQLHIPFELIPVDSAQAILTHIKGQVWVNDKIAKSNHKLETGDVIRTGSNGFVTLKLEDQSTISLPNNSQLRLKQLNSFKRSRINDAKIELEQGSLETRVAPTHSGVGRFEIHTPLSVTGVRGTNLRVHTSSENNQVELLTGAAHLQSTQLSYAPLQKEYGASIASDGSYQVTALLPAPQLSGVQRGKKGWETTIEPVAAAEHYLVNISLDEYGAKIVNRYLASTADLTVALRSTGPGTHYAFIRAVDTNGLMGLDSTIAFPGQATVVSSDGNPVLSSAGQAILLTEY